MRDEALKSHDKFKSKEEKYRSVIPRSSLVGIRLDGKAFHTFTKQFAKPYDLEFMAAMDATTVFILKKLMTQALFAYTVSDEITIFVTDWLNPKSSLPYDGKVEKILSTSASTATAGFMSSMPTVQGAPIFDSRIFTLDDLYELEEYLDWRRLDARKNAISMAAEFVSAGESLQHKSTADRLALLQGTALERLPDGFMWGRLFTRREFPDTVTFTDARTKKPRTLNITRTKWAVTPATRDVSSNLIQDIWKRMSTVTLES